MFCLQISLRRFHIIDDMNDRINNNMNELHVTIDFHVKSSWSFKRKSVGQQIEL